MSIRLEEKNAGHKRRHTIWQKATELALSRLYERAKMGERRLTRRRPQPCVLDPGEEPGEGPPRHHRRGLESEGRTIRRGARKKQPPERASGSSLCRPQQCGRIAQPSFLSSRLLGRERKRSREGTATKGGPRPSAAGARRGREAWSSQTGRAVSLQLWRHARAFLQFRHRSSPQAPARRQPVTTTWPSQDARAH